MSWPQPTDYNAAIQNPALCFADPELRQGQTVGDHFGLPRPHSGNFADVYQVQGPDQQAWAVKCFTREVHGLQQRHQAISEHLARSQRSFMVDFRYLEQGIRIRGQWFPVLEMRWIEGLRLNEFLSGQLDRPQLQERLAQMWVKLAQELREAHLAHGDLQHGNVLLAPGSKSGSLHLRLIDYDGLYVPALAQQPCGELGHPNYQHPRRLREGTYHAEMDRFAHLVIYTALRCLRSGGKALWDRYDNGENLLFREEDLCNPARSELLRELWSLPDADARNLVGRLALAGQGPTERVPLLSELLSGSAVKPLTPVEQDRVRAAFGFGDLREPARPAQPAPPRSPLPSPRPVQSILAQTDQEANPPDEEVPWYLAPAVPPRRNWPLRAAVGGGLLVLGLNGALVLTMGAERPNRARAAARDNGETKAPPANPGPRPREPEKPAAAEPARPAPRAEPDPREKKEPAKPDQDKPRPPDPPPPPDPIAPPSKEHARVGIYEAPMRGTAPILVQKRGDSWKRVTAGGPVFTAEPLVSLPGFTSELRLNSRVLLSLRGNLPEFAVHPLMSYLLESAVILHQTSAFDADLTLLRGRIYIASAKPAEQGPTKVRVRFSGEVWDLTFSDPATEIGIDLLRQYTSDINWRSGEEPRTETYLFVLKGKAQLTQNTRHVHKLEAPPKEAAFEWDNNMDGAVAKPREYSGPRKLDSRLSY